MRQAAAPPKPPKRNLNQLQTEPDQRKKINHTKQLGSEAPKSNLIDDLALNIINMFGLSK